jgi:hypothetical protein
MTWTQEATSAGLEAAVNELARIVRKKLSIPNIGVRHRRVRDTSKQGGGPVGSQYTTYPNSSKPGEPVRRRTGFGQRHIAVSVAMSGIGGEPTFRIGYSAGASYMVMHELGIRYSSGLQQRPVLVPTLYDNAARLSQVYFVTAETFQRKAVTFSKEDIFGGPRMGKA